MARTKKKKSLTEQVKTTSKKPVRRVKEIDISTLVPTGSTMLNLACSDRPEGGFVLGKMVNVIGDSHSGKTLLALSMFAEMAQQKKFDDYRFIYDEPEAACEFDMEYMFGKRTADRIEPISVDEDGDDESSSTVEEFQANILDCIKDGRKFVYVLDSFDALTSDEELKKVEKLQKAREKGKEEEVAGAYGAEKAKGFSKIMRLICRSLKKTDSLLIIISQTRANIGSKFVPKTRSGGFALNFYATHEMWLAVVGQLEREVNKRKRPIGASVRIKVSKNKINGKRRQIGFCAYYDYGVDDVDSCISFMITEGIWRKKAKGLLVIPELDFEGSQRGLVRHVENNNLELKLTKLVAAAWTEIEESLKLNRKPKYT